MSSTAFRTSSLRRGRRALVVAVALAAALPAAAVAIPPGGAVDQSHGAKVTIDRGKVRAGGRIHVVGTNWKSKGSRIQRGAQVTVKLDDRDILAVFPIRKQRFAGWVTIPRPVPAGSHWLRFLAAKPATSVKSKRFRVVK